MPNQNPKKKKLTANQRMRQFRKMQYGGIDEIDYEGKSYPRGKGDYSGLEKRLVSDSISAAAKRGKKK